MKYLTHSVLLLAAAGAIGAESADLATYEKSVRPLLEKHCIGCHGPDKQKASFRLDTLPVNISTSHEAQLWREALDMLNVGEMPPEDEPQPTPEEVAAISDWIGTELRRVEIELQSTGRKVVMRRLNRDEYMNTIRDLLGVDQPDWKVELPLDGKAGGFDTVGSAHSMSTTALNKYLQMADRVVEEAFARPSLKERHPSKIRRFEAEEHVARGFGGFREVEMRYQQSLKRHLGGAVIGGREFLRAHPEMEAAVREGRPTNAEERVALKAVLFDELSTNREQGPNEPHSNLSTTPMVKVGPDNVRIIRYWYYNTRPGVQLNLNDLPDGDYRVRIRAKGEVFPGAPLSRTIWMRLIESKKTAQPLYMVDVPLGEFRVFETDLRVDHGMNLWLEMAERIERGGSTPAKPGDPNLTIDYIEFEGPVIDNSGFVRLFEGWDGTPSPEAARFVLGGFMQRAYRRSVEPEEVQRVATLVDASSPEAFQASMKTALRYVLSSPGFLYLIEPKSAEDTRQPLNQFELASRLSYFLWSTMPDQQLLDLTAAGDLAESGILTQEIERMLADERADSFVDRFADQWLELEKLAPLMPDRRLYPGYDSYLVQCLEREPKHFFREILENDLSVLNFLDSDFAMLNERLAQHYGIDGVSGGEFQRVALGENRTRGGLLGHGAVLTLTSNGTRTSPVNRGVWVLENLLASPPTPPPPNVGQLEDVPDIEGQDKLSVRQLLEKHREIASCASCHQKIDPYGLALENYDAVGAWRTHEMDYDHRTRGLVETREIVVLDRLPRGGEFNDLASFKAQLLADEDRFLRCLAEKMLTYALGRTLEFSDEAVLDELVAGMRANDLTLRSLIQGIAQHEVFLTK